MFSEGYTDLLHYHNNDINYCISNVFSFFSKLGYNIENDFIIKLKTIDKTIQWRTLHKPYYTYAVWCYNKKTKKWYKKIIRPDKELLLYNHLFYNHRIPKHATFQQTYERIQTHTSGAVLHTHSNIFTIDIDNHAYFATHNTLQPFTITHILIHHITHKYKFPLLFAEKNIFTGGYHLFFKLSTILSHKEKSKLLHHIITETDLQSYKMCLHIPTQLRFPFSKTYHPIAIYSHGDEEYVQPSYYLTLQEQQQEHYTIQLPISKHLQKKIEKEKISKKIPHAIFKNSYTNNHIQRITPQQFIATHQNYISRGNRHFPMLHIIRTGKFNGWTIDNIANVILACNDTLNSSKDLQNWSVYRLKKEIQKIFDTSTIHEFKESYIYSQDTFISNIHLIPIFIQELITSDSCLHEMILRCNFKYSERNKKIFSIILLELIGYCYYRNENKKQLTETFDNAIYNQLLQGFQFSPDFCNKLKNHYDILCNTDVYTIVRKILNSDFIFKNIKLHKLPQYKYSLHSQYNYCKLYSLFNFNITMYSNTILSLFIILFFKRFFNSFTNTYKLKYNNNFICCEFLENVNRENSVLVQKSKPFG